MLHPTLSIYKRWSNILPQLLTDVQKLSEIISKDSQEKIVIQGRVDVPWKHFLFVGYLREDFFRAQYFAKVFAANHSSSDTLFLRRALATINCIYKMNLTDLFKAAFYFKGALATIHLSCNIIFSGGSLQWSSIFNSTVSFKQALVVIPFL